jgi:uridine kinase
MVLMNKAPFIIGITGGSGSGKTFFLNCFLNHCSSNEICLISQDDYYIPIVEMNPEENKLHNFDLPSAIDDQLFLNDIRKLISGETVYKKEYTFNKPGLIPNTLKIDPAPIILVEGLFILHFEEIASLLDLKIFLEAEEQIALQRRIKRDLIERGYSEDDVSYKWINHVIPSYKKYLLPHKSKCTRLISNNIDMPDEMINLVEELYLELRAAERI